jgi:hypothetical protein
MKAITLITTTLMGLTTPAFATTTYLNCTSGTRELTVQINGVETVVPYYNVELKYMGQVTDRFEVAQKQDSAKTFMAETLNSDTQGRIKTVGYFRDSKEGFYQVSANKGMSPLPAMMFKNCRIK